MTEPAPSGEPRQSSPPLLTFVADRLRHIEHNLTLTEDSLYDILTLLGSGIVRSDSPSPTTPSNLAENLYLLIDSIITKSEHITQINDALRTRLIGDYP